MRRFLRKYVFEIVILLAVAAVAVWIVVPNLLTGINRSRQKRTMADIRSIATAWEARATDVNSYRLPARRGHVEYANLRRALTPTYIKVLPRVDGWGHPYDFSSSDQTYEIRSFGRDGTLGGTAASGGTTTDFDCDIVYENGTFMEFPEGT
jgi:type II secretory pathway pseudopilin PulG